MDSFLKISRFLNLLSEINDIHPAEGKNIFFTGQNFLVAASLDIILDRGERWRSGLSSRSKIMSKLGLTAEKSDIEWRVLSKWSSKMVIHIILYCFPVWDCIAFIVGSHFWNRMWRDHLLNVTFLSRQTEFGHKFGSWGKPWTSRSTTNKNYVQTRSAEKVLSSQKSLVFFNAAGWISLVPESRFRNLLSCSSVWNMNWIKLKNVSY